jgi:hypothetical protein
MNAKFSICVNPDNLIFTACICLQVDYVIKCILLLFSYYSLHSTRFMLTLCTPLTMTLVGRNMG